MSKIPIEYLRHISDECHYLKDAVGDNLIKEHFLDDATLKRACVRSLEVIGEATKNIPADFKIKMGFY